LKTDARVRYTKKVIRENFFSLLRKQPINKISVTSICDLAEINRATFYRYYADPFDIMRQIEEEFITSLKILIEKSDNRNITEIILMITNTLRQNADEYILLFSENGDPAFFDRLIQESYSIKKIGMEKLFPKGSPMQRRWLYLFMTHGFTSILKAWAVNGMHEDSAVVADFINDLNNMILKGLL